ncbi:hypothetical protein [Borreliella bavariensis]|nr:hypothetical protein [Borreliella bavariensis]
MKVLLENFSISNNKIEVEKIYKPYYEYVNAEIYFNGVCDYLKNNSNSK